MLILDTQLWLWAQQLHSSAVYIFSLRGGQNQSAEAGLKEEECGLTEGLHHGPVYYIKGLFWYVNHTKLL